jgi:Flp pilus assembly protein TadG
MNLRSRFRKGQIMVITALVLPVVLAGVGLGTDIGVLYFNWMRLQKAADTAALAGASQLTGDSSTTDDSAVTACAQLYACLNGIGVTPAGTCPHYTETCTGSGSDNFTVTPASDGKSVTVTAKRSVPYFFLHLIGLTQGGVDVHATAGILPTQGACGLAPFGMPCKQNCTGKGCYGKTGSTDAAPGQGDSTCGGAYNFNTSNPSAGTQIELKSDWSISGVPGNWDPLALGGDGAAMYRSNIAYGSGGTINPGDWLSTETGNIVGPTAEGFSKRGLSLPNSTTPTVPSTISPNDPHVVVVPLVDFSQAGKPGKTSVPVLDFVTLYVTGLVGKNNTIVATVIPPVAWCGTPTVTTKGTGAPFMPVLCSDSGCPTLPASSWPAS